MVLIFLLEQFAVLGDFAAAKAVQPRVSPSFGDVGVVVEPILMMILADLRPQASVPASLQPGATSRPTSALADHLFWSTPGSSCSGDLNSPQLPCSASVRVGFERTRTAVSPADRSRYSSGAGRVRVR